MLHCTHSPLAEVTLHSCPAPHFTLTLTLALTLQMLLQRVCQLEAASASQSTLPTTTAVPAPAAACISGGERAPSPATAPAPAAPSASAGDPPLAAKPPTSSHRSCGQSSCDTTTWQPSQPDHRQQGGAAKGNISCYAGLGCHTVQLQLPQQGATHSVISYDSGISHYTNAALTSLQLQQLLEAQMQTTQSLLRAVQERRVARVK